MAPNLMQSLPHDRSEYFGRQWRIALRLTPWSAPACRVHALLVLHVEFSKLLNTQVQGENYSQYIWAALPYFLTSFGFAGLIPSLVKYYGPEPKTVHRCVLFGTLITLGLYLIWILVAFGTLSRTTLAPVIAAGGNIGDLVVGFQGVAEANSRYWQINFCGLIKLSAYV